MNRRGFCFVFSSLIDTFVFLFHLGMYFFGHT